MSNWASRIKERMTELGLNQDELAKRVGLTRGAITHYLMGRRVPPLRQFQKLAHALKTSPAWLQFGTESNDSQTQTSANHQKNTTKEIPVLSWKQAANFIGTEKIKPNEISEWIPNLYTNQTNWYALRVKGDSMISTSGHSKSFFPEDILIIDPDKEAKAGDFVIALLPRANEATFKQYVNDGGIYYLKPLNPQYPIAQIDKGTYISGIIVACLTMMP